MSHERSIARVVRVVRMSALDERAERRAHWASRSVADRLREVESLRRMWPELTGDPDVAIARVVHKRALGQRAPTPPPRGRTRD